MVWLLMIYSAVTVTLLTVTEGIPVILGMLYNILCVMALACHAKTSLTDPGSVPLQAIPSERQRLLKESHSMCGQCQTFKPPMSHHCRICNRCISRMDHHCPWYVYYILCVSCVVENHSLFGLKDEQLCGSGQFEAFSLVSRLYLDLCGLFIEFVWLELLFLCRRRLYISPGCFASGTNHDPPRSWGFFVYE